VKESADPLNAKYYELLKKVTEPGPGIRYKILISNNSISQLLFYHGPIAKSLTTTVGYMMQRGPFTELHLKPLDQRVWTPVDQLTGIRDIVRELGVAVDSTTLATAAAAGTIPGPTAPSSAPPPIMKTENLALRMSAPVKICGPANKKCLPFALDIPQIALRLTDEADCAKFTWTYHSITHQKVISDASGATLDDVYVDLAIHNPQLGEGVVSQLQLDTLDTVMLEPSVLTRRTELTKQRITEEIHFVRGAGLETQAVDMTEFYSQLGIVQFRPTFGEFLYPPRAWLLTPDQNAVDYIVARLGLSRHFALQSHPAITMSHNVAVIKRLTGGDSHFKLKELLEALLNTQYKITT
jgi:hypothetical protein